MFFTVCVGIGDSGSDLHALCQEAAMIPFRELGALVSTIEKNEVIYIYTYVLAIVKV